MCRCDVDASTLCVCLLFPFPSTKHRHYPIALFGTINVRHEWLWGAKVTRTLNLFDEKIKCCIKKCDHEFRLVPNRCDIFLDYRFVDVVVVVQACFKAAFTLGQPERYCTLY